MAISLLLPLGLAFIMFVVGLGLRIDDFYHIAEQPKAFAFGLMNQMILLPLIGICLALLLDGPKEFAFGIVILAACPGGITSNLICLLARGNTALSVSFTATSSIAALFTIPMILTLGTFFLGTQVAHVTLPFGQIMGSVFVVTALPLCLGILLNTKAPETAYKLQAYGKTIASSIFMLIVLAAFLRNQDKIAAHFQELALYLIALNFLTMGAGLVMARSLDLSWADGAAISIEGGLQNVALAIFISVNLFENPAFMTPAIIYAIVMNLSLVPVVLFFRRRIPFMPPISQPLLKE